MDTHPTFRTILLSVFTALIALLVVGAWLFTASSGLSQSSAPDGPDPALSQPASLPPERRWRQAAAAPLLPASLGGDGGAVVVTRLRRLQ